MSYMDIFNFFRDYIPLISTIAEPLDALRIKPGRLTLTRTELKSFNARRTFCEAPILYFPDFSMPFYVATEPSNYGIADVLYQLVGDEKGSKSIRYISFVARSSRLP
jgi:hypothetical protein